MSSQSVTICPCVTPSSPNPQLYREQVERVSFASRIQIDLMDGVFAPNKNTNPIQVWWPEGILADIHLMYQDPSEHIGTLVSLKPNLIIFHIESDGDIKEYLSHVKHFGVKAGLAILADTPVEQAQASIEVADHVMLFAGKLGHFGGEAQLGALEKISQIKQINPEVEIGWDGGVKLSNIKQIAKAGVNVINVGGSIQLADNPKSAYDELVSAVSQVD